MRQRQRGQRHQEEERREGGGDRDAEYAGEMDRAYEIGDAETQGGTERRKESGRHDDRKRESDAEAETERTRKETR